MNFGDFIIIALIFIISFTMNKDTIFSSENLISMAITAVIVLVIIMIFVFDYLPILLLTAAKNDYYENRDTDKFLEAIERFKKKNKLVSHSYKAYLYEAEVKLQQGEFSQALDCLLYCSKKDMDLDSSLKVMLLRCKILMFMDQFNPSIPDWQFIIAHQKSIPLEEIFNFNLIRGYLYIQEGELEKAQKMVEKLLSYNRNLNSKFHNWEFESKWLNALITFYNYSQHNYNNQLNMLKGSGAPKYIIKSIQRQEKAD